MTLIDIAEAEKLTDKATKEQLDLCEKEVALVKEVYFQAGIDAVEKELLRANNYTLSAQRRKDEWVFCHDHPDSIEKREQCNGCIIEEAISAARKVKP